MITVALLNDTSVSPHFGCKATVQAFHAACAAHDMEIVVRVPLGSDWRSYPLGDVDLVIVNGEGSIHHGRHQYLLEVAQRYPSVLVNAVWDTNPSLFSRLSERFLMRTVRERLSQQQLPDSMIVPDMTFYLELKRSGDPMDQTGEATDSKSITPEWFSKFHRIRTGLFHGVTHCAMMGIPFSAFGGNTHKIRGILMDMDAPELYGADPPSEMKASIVEYTRSAKGRIDDLFDEIRSLSP